MKKTNLFLVSIALTTTLASDSFAYFHLCTQRKFVQNIKTPQELAEFQAKKAYYDSKVNLDILNWRDDEIRLVSSNMKRQGPQYLLTNAAIDALNTKYPNTNWSSNHKLIIEVLNEMEFKTLNSYRPDDPSDSRHDFLPNAGDIPARQFADRLMQTIDRNQVVGYANAHKYEQPGTSIGYCFGRGCYIDVLLMSLGLDRDAVKKIWAVGPMQSGGLTWQFHIGHMVRLPDNSWVVLDNVPGRVLTVEQWAAHFKRENRDGMLRFYVTDSEKFTPSLGAYNDTQLGLNIPRDRDWYRDYFDDLMRWTRQFRSATDEEKAAYLGIRLDQLPKRPTPQNPTREQIEASRREEIEFDALPPRDVMLSSSGEMSSGQGPGKLNHNNGGGFMGFIKNRINGLRNRLGLD
ncbi:MAG: hypothetical protein JNL11_11530 [Bdellovibrionaceae bacterium]|nr:hypothetical protein [Pseudobdellovibrionaceae bacterium]